MSGQATESEAAAHSPTHTVTVVKSKVPTLKWRVWPLCVVWVVGRSPQLGRRRRSAALSSGLRWDLARNATQADQACQPTLGLRASDAAGDLILGLRTDADFPVNLLLCVRAITSVDETADASARCSTPAADTQTCISQARLAQPRVGKSATIADFSGRRFGLRDFVPPWSAG